MKTIIAHVVLSPFYLCGLILFIFSLPIRLIFWSIEQVWPDAFNNPYDW